MTEITKSVAEKVLETVDAGLCSGIGHDGTRSAAYAADAAAADAADAARKTARDKSLADFAEAVVQLLIEMKAPGAQWLELAPLES